MIGCNMRFHQCLQEIKKILQHRKIGKVISVRAESGSHLPNWHPGEDYRTSYASLKKLGGGVVLTCIHEIDYLRWFFGAVDQAFSFTGKFSNLELSVEDLSAILLKFKETLNNQLTKFSHKATTYRIKEFFGREDLPMNNRPCLA